MKQIEARQLAASLTGLVSSEALLEISPASLPSAGATTVPSLGAGGFGMSVGRSGEIISRSSLSRYDNWPAEDPRGRDMDARDFEPRDNATFHECARPRGLHAHLSAVSRSSRPAQDKVMEILNHRSIQFNSRARLASSSYHRHLIEQECVRSQPIRIVLPLFCVISNPVKRFQASAITAAEIVTLLTLRAICDAVVLVYPPGLIFELVADSVFYSTPFGVNTVEANGYILQIQEEIRRYEVGHCIRLHDMAHVLAAQAQAFNQRYDYWIAAYSDDPLCDGITPENHAAWMSSMRACINVSKLGKSYQWLREQFADATGMNLPDEVSRDARIALTEYRALKAAAADVEWENYSFPGALRATIHTKPIATLGMRIYPEYKFNSRLLPYHGIPLIKRFGTTGRRGMVVEPEMFCFGQERLTRVVGHGGKTIFYEERAGL